MLLSHRGDILSHDYLLERISHLLSNRNPRIRYRCRVRDEMCSRRCRRKHYDLIVEGIMLWYCYDDDVARRYEAEAPYMPRKEIYS